MYYIHSHAKYHKLNSAKGTNVIFKAKWKQQEQQQISKRYGILIFLINNKWCEDYYYNYL